MRRILFLAVLAIAGAASGATLDQAFDRTFDLHPGAKFRLENTNGAVTVRAWDQPRVRIHAVKHVESRDDAAAKKAINDLRIEVTPSAGGLRVRTIFPMNDQGFFQWLAGTNVNAQVSYEIEVPRAVDLDVETVNGHIDANGVRGGIRLATTNGHIEALRCGGALDASTTNGRITAELLDVTPGKRVSLETTNGRIALSLPKSVAARIDAETSNGSIDTMIPILATQKSERHSLHGTINGGGSGEVRLRTTNGSIEIHAL